MNHPISKKGVKPKKLLVTHTTLAQHRALAAMVDVPTEEVTDAYIRSVTIREASKSYAGIGLYSMLQPLIAMREADKEGREYTPIFWHRTEDGVMHLTMWDMNTPNDNSNTVSWSTLNSPEKW
jgi:hypothetical protein